MQYILLIYGNENGYAQRSEAERVAIRGEFMKFTQEIVKSGHFRAGDPLHPTSTASTVRLRDGKVLTTDGPFAETKEQLGGYYIVDVQNLDEALGIASRIPAAHWGSIEVRPILQIPRAG